MFINCTSVTKNQEDNLPTRFVVVILEPQQAYSRLFRGKDGQEVEYQENTPKARDYVAPQTLDFDRLAAKLGTGGSALPNGLLDEQKANLHPRVRGKFEFWIDSEKPRAKDLGPGLELRILTMGDSIFVDDFMMLNAKLNVFKDMGEKGAELSGEYEKAIMQYAEPEVLEDNREGVDEDEWSD